MMISLVRQIIVTRPRYKTGKKIKSTQKFCRGEIITIICTSVLEYVVVQTLLILCHRCQKKTKNRSCHSIMTVDDSFRSICFAL
jgi:hypothetical protein